MSLKINTLPQSLTRWIKFFNHLLIEIVIRWLLRQPGVAARLRAELGITDWQRTGLAIMRMDVAVALGESKALVLQKITDWMSHNQRANKRSHYFDDCWWTYGTYEQWHQYLPCLSLSTIKRLLRELEKDGLLLSKSAGQRGKWYTVNLEAVDAAVAGVNLPQAAKPAKQKGLGPVQLSLWEDQAGQPGGSKESPYQQIESSNKSKSIKSKTSSKPTHHPDDDLGILGLYQKRFGRPRSEKIPTLKQALALLGEHQWSEIVQRCIQAGGRSWTYVERALENEIARLRVTEEPISEMQPVELIRRRIEDPLSSPPPLPPSPLEGTEEGRRFSMAWTQVELQFDHTTFCDWMKGCTLLAVEGNILRIGIRHQGAADQCRHRYYRDLRRICSDAFGRRVELDFVVLSPSGSVNDQPPPPT